MPGQLSDETQVAFLEGSTCFSEEEWQLLQEWRKNFYKNMMKEIDQAMMSLDEVVSVHIKNEDDASFLGPEDSMRLSISTTMARDSTPPVSSVGIKEEAVTYPIDIQDCSSGESFNSDALETGDGPGCSQRRDRREGGLETGDGRAPGCWQSRDKREGDNGNKNGKMESPVKYNRISRLCKSTVKQGYRVEPIPHWQSDCCESTHSTLHQTPCVMVTEASNICEGRMESEQSVPCSLNSQQTNIPYNYPESEKIHPKNNIGRPPRTHQRTARFTCKECGKSFTTISYLRKHERFHTGERPHRCTTCGKTFSLLGGLQRHQKLHTGEKPHQCNMCGEYFSRTDVLSRHQKTHTKTIQKCVLSILEIA
ncbi:uncharacterized protein LOC144791728 isoform X2 [Lissotriton helveticus]